MAAIISLYWLLLFSVIFYNFLRSARREGLRVLKDRVLAGVLKDAVLVGVQVRVEAGVGARVYPGLEFDLSSVQFGISFS